MSKIDDLIKKHEQTKNEVKSEFLQEYYDNQKLGKRIAYNPRDPCGRRLSNYWQQGDNVFSVTKKKLYDFLYHALNPDTYSTKSYQQIRKYMQLHDTQIFMIMAAISISMMYFFPYMLPRMKKVKQDYILHQYVKKNFFEKELGIEKTQRRRLRLHEMKQILKVVNSSEK